MDVCACSPVSGDYTSVEFNASARAVRLLDSLGILRGDEVGRTRKVLGAAALTYVAAVAVSLLQLLRLITCCSEEEDEMTRDGNKKNTAGKLATAKTVTAKNTRVKKTTAKTEKTAKPAMAKAPSADERADSRHSP